MVGKARVYQCVWIRVCIAYAYLLSIKQIYIYKPLCSGLNSVSAVLLEDIIRSHLDETIGETQIKNLLQLISKQEKTNTATCMAWCKQ